MAHWRTEDMRIFLKCLPQRVQQSCQFFSPHSHQSVWFLSFYDGGHIPSGKVSVTHLQLMWHSLTNCPAREPHSYNPHMPSLSLISKGNVFAQTNCMSHLFTIYIACCWLYPGLLYPPIIYFLILVLVLILILILILILVLISTY